MSQLQMLFRADLTAPPPPPSIPSGYTLRPLRRNDLQAYFDLRIAAGFTDPWTEKDYEAHKAALLPDGLLIIADENDRPVAAASAELGREFPSPYNGVMGWVVAAPQYRGKGLGKAICTAVTRKLLAHKRKQLFLLTDDWREPAIAIYLKLGWRPRFHEPDMPQRWDTIFKKLNMPPVEPFPELEGI